MMGEQEPIWLTLLFVFIWVVLYFSYYLPKDVEKQKKHDLEYCKRKGITLEQLIRRRNIARDRRIPKSTREYVLARDGYRCKMCDSNYNLEIDHIYPFSLGGGNEASNLQVLCKSCNLSKGASV